MRSCPRRAFTLIIVLVIPACGNPDPATNVSTQVHEVRQSDSAWTAELKEHRETIGEGFRTSKTSPMAGIQYLKSDPGDQAFLARQEKQFSLADSVTANVVVSVIRDEETWRWHDHEQDVVCRVEDEEVASGTALDGPALFEFDGLTLSFYPAEDRVTFIVFDPAREEMKSFEHLLYFPPDRKYAVEARLSVLEEPDALEIPTSRNLKKTFYRYAKIEFQLDGQKQELTALKRALTGEGSEDLFIPFRDATTGHETYGAGRFLDLEEPEEESFVLDFNRAYNPLCNYSPAYNCALPPRENYLEVAVRAGEKTYPH